MIKKRVDLLLVEDNPGDVELTLRVFQRHNLVNSIEVVRDGDEALDFLFSEGGHSHRNGAGPKVVLLDLKLLKIDGLEVLEKLRADPRTRSLPVVVLTSSQEDGDIQNAYRLGANSYIVKPVDFGRFTEVVRELGLYWLLLNQTTG